MDAVKIIAEGEVNHNRDVELGKRLVEAAKSCGADFIKFQCFVADSFIAPGSSFLPIFKETELSLEDFRALRDHAAETGITMISTASDLDGLRMITELDLPIIKLGSTNITNVPLLEGLAATGKPIYLSTGASTLGEIEAALDILTRSTDDITLFHCTVKYPAAPEDLNLRAIATMKAAFPGTAIGYSDHSIGITAPVAAAVLGATVLEKHFTLDNALPGPDHAFSTNPQDFRRLVEAVREAERMLGDPRKRPIADEQGARLGGRRYLTAIRGIPAGAVIAPDMIRSRRIDVAKVDTGTLLPPALETVVHGWTAARAIADGAALSWADLVPPADSGETQNG